MKDKINILPDDIIGILQNYQNLTCHTCLIKINKIKIFKKSIFINKKFIFCCKECYNFI